MGCCASKAAIIQALPKPVIELPSMDQNPMVKVSVVEPNAETTQVEKPEKAAMDTIMDSVISETLPEPLAEIQSRAEIPVESVVDSIKSPPKYTQIELYKESVGSIPKATII